MILSWWRAAVVVQVHGANGLSDIATERSIRATSHAPQRYCTSSGAGAAVSGELCNQHGRVAQIVRHRVMSSSATVWYCPSTSRLKGIDDCVALRCLIADHQDVLSIERRSPRSGGVRAAFVVDKILPRSDSWTEAHLRPSTQPSCCSPRPVVRSGTGVVKEVRFVTSFVRLKQPRRAGFVCGSRLLGELLFSTGILTTMNRVESCRPRHANTTLSRLNSFAYSPSHLLNVRERLSMRRRQTLHSRRGIANLTHPQLVSASAPSHNPQQSRI